MKLYITFVTTVALFMLAGCQENRPAFVETVIDDQAPEHLWMKTTGDLNSDGKTDIVVGGWLSGGLVAYLAPDWSKISLNDSVKVSTDAEICDIDNDDAPDVVAIINRAIVWFSGPDWKLHHIDSIVAHDVEVYDFDDDGLLDVIARNQGAFGELGGHTLYYYNQTASGSWSSAQQEIPDGEGLKMADINSDGRQDIVTNAHWYENTGAMSNWKQHQFSQSWTWPNTYIDVADVNGDGRPDILHSPAELARNHYRISWFEAPEDATSAWREHIVADSIETIVHSIAAADFDGDERLDLVTAEMQQGADPDDVAIFYNTGSGDWEKQVISTGGCHSMQVFDADGDGDLDVFGANFAENIVRLWLNQKTE